MKKTMTAIREIQADSEVDARYAFLRTRHGSENPQANGYRLGGFFLREQRVLLSFLDHEEVPVFDVACGSGLMLSPLLQQGRQVYGLDFNHDGCCDAAHNGLRVVRGDAFNMPMADDSVGQIVNCQFLNQQSARQTQKFITEGARVLKTGGKMLILWRHADSLVHILSHTVFTFLDRFTGQPPFPQYRHPMEEIEEYATRSGLVVDYKAVTLPFLKPDLIPYGRFLHRLIGASLFIVLKKP